MQASLFIVSFVVLEQLLSYDLDPLLVEKRKENLALTNRIYKLNAFPRSVTGFGLDDCKSERLLAVFDCAH